MMLMAFAQLEGFDFMRATFADPLLEVLQVRLRPALATRWKTRRGPAHRSRPGSPRARPRITQFDAALEVNPAKGVSEAAVEANIARLETACTRIMDEIRKQRELITPSFRRLCSFVRKSVEEALDSAETSAADAAIVKADSEAIASGGLKVSPSGTVTSVTTQLTPALKVLSSFFFLRYAVPGTRKRASEG